MVISVYTRVRFAQFFFFLFLSFFPPPPPPYWTQRSASVASYDAACRGELTFDDGSWTDDHSDDNLETVK